MDAYTGEIAALGTAICWSFTAIFFSYSGRRMGSLNVSMSRLLFALLFLTGLHWALEGSLFPSQVEPFRWGWLGLSSILGLVVGDTLLFYAFVRLGPRLSTLMMALVPIINTIAGRILFDEAVTRRELLGISLAVAGVAWVVTERRRAPDGVRDRLDSVGILCGLGGALGQATNLLAAKNGLVGGFSTLSATQIRIVIAVLVLWSLALLRGQVRPIMRKWRDRRAFAAMLGGTVAGPVVGIWLSMIAIQLARVGIASTLMALPPVFVIPLEYAINRTRVSLRSATGTALALGGVALILLP